MSNAGTEIVFPNNNATDIFNTLIKDVIILTPNGGNWQVKF